MEIFCRILSIPLNIVMDLNNVLSISTHKCGYWLTCFGRWMLGQWIVDPAEVSKELTVVGNEHHRSYTNSWPLNLVWWSVFNHVHIAWEGWWSELHPKLRNVNPHNITHSLIYRKPRERMFVVQTSLLVCHISLPCIANFVIYANRQKSQPTPLHCCHVLICGVSPSYSSSYANCWMLVHA